METYGTYNNRYFGIFQNNVYCAALLYSEPTGIVLTIEDVLQIRGEVLRGAVLLIMLNRRMFYSLQFYSYSLVISKEYVKPLSLCTAPLGCVAQWGF